MNKPSIDWATSRIDMLLTGILGESWREDLGRKRSGLRVMYIGEVLLKTLASTLREAALLGPRMHECNHPTDYDVIRKLDYIEVRADCEDQPAFFWCSRCGAFGEIGTGEYANFRDDMKIGWRRPEAPVNKPTPSPIADTESDCA